MGIGAIKIFKLLRMNNIHYCDSEMEHVDVADHLRGSYRVDHLLHNRKLCWLLVCYIFGVFIKNTYVL